MPATVPALAAAESARQRTRAQRNARSLPLAFSGLTVLVVAATSLLGTQWFWLTLLVPTTGLVALYVTAFARRLPTGLGVGSDGYGIALVVSALVTFLFPPLAIAPGPPFILGVGLVLIGLRASDRLLWVAGLGTMAASFALASTTGIGYGPSTAGLVGQGVLGVALLGTALVALRAEHATLAAVDEAPSIGDPATDNLCVLAVLGDADEADQPTLARLTGLDERRLAARLHDLTEAGLVQARVTPTRNWAQITRDGREELRTRREALRRVTQNRKA
jgi:hypothetical protein